MVKIQTALASNFGHTVLFGELPLTFDKLGFAEVESKEQAKWLVTNYEGWLYMDDTLKKANSEKKKDTDSTELVAEIDRLSEKVKDREATILAVQNECAEWKALVENYQVKAAEAEEELAGVKIQFEKQNKELELKVSLAYKTSAELIDFCKTLEIPDDRYKGMNKADLITVILDESRNK